MYSVELVDPQALLLLSYNNVYGVFVKHAHEHCGIVCVLCQLQVHKPSLHPTYMLNFFECVYPNYQFCFLNT